MKKNPLHKTEHGTIPAKKAPNVASSKHTIVSGEKYVKKPLNAHNHQPGFTGKVA